MNPSVINYAFRSMGPDEMALWQRRRQRAFRWIGAPTLIAVGATAIPSFILPLAVLVVSHDTLDALLIALTLAIVASGLIGMPVLLTTVIFYSSGISKYKQAWAKGIRPTGWDPAHDLSQQANPFGHHPRMSIGDHMLRVLSAIVFGVAGFLAGLGLVTVTCLLPLGATIVDSNAAAAWLGWLFFLAPPLVLLAITIGGAVIGWRAATQQLRMQNPAACRACGYDLTANATGRCPECGEVVPFDQRDKLILRDTPGSPV